MLGIRRITMGLVLAAAGVPLWVAPAQAADPAPGLRLEASSVQASVRPGEPVRVHLVVINATGAGCDLLKRPDGALQVVAASRDGQALAPTFDRATFIDGAPAALARAAVATAPNASVEMDVSAGDAVATLTPLRDGSGVVARWPVATAGRYELMIAYEVPPVAGEHACVGLSNVVTVAFTVGEPRSYTWILIAVAAVVLVLLGVLLLLLLRRRRRSRPAEVAAGVVLALVAAAGLVTVDVRAASASTQFNADPNDPSSKAVYDGCWSSIMTFDPGLVAKLAGPGVRVIIQAGPFGESTSTHGEKDGEKRSAVLWDPHDQAPFLGEPNVLNNPCAALYHELVHAFDNANDQNNDEYCNDTTVLFDEVRTVNAENRFRVFLGVKEQRRKYDGKPIPPTETDCIPPPPGQRRADNGAGGVCRALNGGCGSTNGDPHLVTYDGRFYDFHAAGEFVATAASAGDLEIQVRQGGFRDSRTVAVNSAIAVRVGPTRLGFYVSGMGVLVYRDGQVVVVADGDTALPGGAKLSRVRDPYSGEAYDITWADGTTASVARLGSWGLRISVRLAPVRAKMVTGLLGNFDGDMANDPAPKGGAPLAGDLTYDQLYPAFADSWRVTDATSLFDYAPGQNTATFTDRTFPERFVRPADFPADQVARARVVCGWLGVTNVALLDACVLDIVVTGLAAFAVAAGDVQTQVPAGPTTGFAVDGAAATATIGQAGGTARLTFAGTAGTRAYVLADSATLPDQCGVLALRAPDDTLLTSGCIIGGKGQLDGTVLPTTGTYTVVVDPAGGTTGTVNLRIISSVDRSGTVRVDGPEVEVSVSQAGQTAQLTFDAQAGQKVFIDVPSATLPDQCGLPILRSPDGTLLEAGCVINGKGMIDGTTLPITGPYAIVFDPAESNTGQARVKVIGVTDQRGTITIGGEATAAVRQPGGLATFTFTLSTAARVKVEVLSNTLPDQCGVPSLGDSEGRAIKIGCIINGKGGVDPITLQAGQYTVVVNPAERNVGEVRLRLTTQ